MTKSTQQFLINICQKKARISHNVNQSLNNLFLHRLIQPKVQTFDTVLLNATRNSALPGPSSTERGFPVRRTGSPTVTPATEKRVKELKFKHLLSQMQPALSRTKAYQYTQHRNQKKLIHDTDPLEVWNQIPSGFQTFQNQSNNTNRVQQMTLQEWNIFIYQTKIDRNIKIFPTMIGPQLHPQLQMNEKSQ